MCSDSQVNQNLPETTASGGYKGLRASPTPLQALGTEMASGMKWAPQNLTVPIS